MRKSYFFASALIIGMAAFILSSCQVEITKRLYSSGYYLEWHWKQKQVAKTTVKLHHGELEKSPQKDLTATTIKEEEKPLSLYTLPDPGTKLVASTLHSASNSNSRVNQFPVHLGLSNDIRKKEPDKVIVGKSENAPEDGFPYFPFALLTSSLLLLTPPARRACLKYYNHFRRFIPSKAAKDNSVTVTIGFGCLTLIVIALIIWFLISWL